MRHILTLATFIIVFLAPSLAHAEASDGYNYRQAFQGTQRAFDKEYKKLSEADQTKFQTIVNQAIGEDLMPLNQGQLVGFMGFINSNPTASCAVADATDKDARQYGYRLPHSEMMMGMNSSHGETINYGQKMWHPRSAGLNVGLMCVAGSVKKFFTGLPASTLNTYYNSNIQLASETGTASATPTTVASVSTQPTTSYNSYMTQSASDAKQVQGENTVFSEQSVQPSDGSGMHFSNANSEASH